MHELRLTGLAFALLAPLAIAQPPPADPAVDPAVEEAPPEALPEFQIEVILFAHRDFNPNEEDFAHEREVATPPEPSEFADIAVGRQLDPVLAPGEVEPQPQGPVLLDPLAADEPSPQDAAPSAEPGLEPLAAAAASAELPAEPFHFRLLAPEELTLNDLYARIERLGAYTPLLHGGWVQPGLPEDQAHGFDLALLGAVNPSGTIELYLSRFLHLNVDLTYRPQQEAGSPYDWRDTNASGLGAFALPPSYVLHAERRLRSGEIHYIDHPAFGMLVQIRPQPVSEPPQSTEPAA